MSGTLNQTSGGVTWLDIDPVYPFTNANVQGAIVVLRYVPQDFVINLVGDGSGAIHVVNETVAHLAFPTSYDLSIPVNLFTYEGSTTYLPFRVVVRSFFWNSGIVDVGEIILESATLTLGSTGKSLLQPSNGKYYFNLLSMRKTSSATFVRFRAFLRLTANTNNFNRIWILFKQIHFSWQRLHLCSFLLA